MGDGAFIRNFNTRNVRLFKFATTATGIDVTGTATMDGLTVDGIIALTDSGSSNRNILYLDGSDNIVLATGTTAGARGIDLYTNNNKSLSVAENGDISFYDDTGTSPALFWDASAERLGIGTTSPAVPLEIASTDQIGIRYTNSTATSTARLYLTAGTASGILQQYGNTHSTNANEFRIISATGDVTIAPSSTEKVRVTTAGNVGIGTDNPSEKLHIYGTGATISGKIEASDGNQASLDLKNSEGEFRIINDGGELYVYDSTNAAERFRIDTSGNVGIGTSSPNQKLNVSGGRSYFGANNEAYAIGVGYNGTRTAANQTYFIGATNAAAPDLQFSNSDGGEKVRITHAGNVGIGTDSPSTALEVKGDGTIIQVSSADYDVALLGRRGSSGVDLDKGYMRLRDTGTTKVAIDSAGNSYFNGGNVGIGTSSPYAELSIKSASPQVYLETAANGNVQINFNENADQLDVMVNNSSGKIAFGTNSTERMRIDSSGNLLVGTTNIDPTFNRVDGINISSQDAIFSRGGAAWDLGRNSTSGIHISFYTDNGSARVGAGNISSNGSTTAYNTSSDARLKDVTGSARGLEVINELNPVSYNWKADGQADEGLIAQEVLDIVPNAVSGSEEEMYQMDYSKLVVHLVAGMKEQQTQIEALQSEINLLKGE